MAGDGHEQLDADFWAIVGDVSFELSPETTIAMELAESPAIKRTLDWLAEAEHCDPAAAEDARYAMIKEMSSNYGIEPEHCERVLDIARWIMEEEDKHGQA